MEGPTAVAGWPNQQNDLHSSINTYKAKEMFCDCTLACKETFFRAHKLIMAASSELFERIFLTTQDKNPVIILHEIEAWQMECLLNYMYKGETQVTNGNFLALCRVAKYLQIKGFDKLEICYQEMKEQKDRRDVSDLPLNMCHPSKLEAHEEQSPGKLEPRMQTDLMHESAEPLPQRALSSSVTKEPLPGSVERKPRTNDRNIHSSDPTYGKVNTINSPSLEKGIPYLSSNSNLHNWFHQPQQLPDPKYYSANFGTQNYLTPQDDNKSFPYDYYNSLRNYYHQTTPRREAKYQPLMYTNENIGAIYENRRNFDISRTRLDNQVDLLPFHTPDRKPAQKPSANNTESSKTREEREKPSIMDVKTEEIDISMHKTSCPVTRESFSYPSTTAFNYGVNHYRHSPLVLASSRTNSSEILAKQKDRWLRGPPPLLKIVNNGKLNECIRTGATRQNNKPKFFSKDPLLAKIPTNKRKRVRGPKSWEFLLRLLRSPTSNPSLIKWEDEAAGIFRLMKPEVIAHRWGQRTGKHINDILSYESFSRGLRYHYATGALCAVSEKSFVYQFGPKAQKAARECFNHS